MSSSKKTLIKGLIFLSLTTLVAPASLPGVASAENDEVKSETGSAASAQNEPKIKGFPAPDKVLATVNGAKITVLMHEVSVNALIPYVNYHQAVPDEKMVAIRKKALEDLIDDALFVEEAKKRGIEIEKQVITDGLEEVKKNLPPNVTLDEALKKSKMTMKDLKDDLKHKAMITRIKELRRKEVYNEALALITDEYMKNYYEKNLDKFVLPEKFRTREILLRTDPAGGNKAMETVFARAEDIKKRADAGEDFAELAKANSQASHATKGGDTGWSHKGSLPEYFVPIEAYIDTMKPGEVSEPIRTIYGYHIVKLEERSPQSQLKFEELNKEKLKGELAASEATRQWNAWRASLRTGAKIVYHDVE